MQDQIFSGNFEETACNFNELNFDFITVPTEIMLMQSKGNAIFVMYSHGYKFLEQI